MRLLILWRTFLAPLGLLTYALLLLTLYGCNDSDNHKTKATELLSIPVNSTNILEVEKFNQTILRDKQAGSPWGTDSVLVISAFTSLGNGKDSIMSMIRSDEGAHVLNVIVINDGFSGDSVRGERFDLILEKDSDEFWSLRQAKRSFRCWPERGHTNYSTRPCE